MQQLLEDRCILVDICRASTQEDLKRVVRESHCEPYEDPIPEDWNGPPLAPGVTTIRKFFKKGSMLEWCDLPGAWERHIVPVGTDDEWSERARRQWQEQVGKLPDVGSVPVPKNGGKGVAPMPLEVRRNDLGELDEIVGTGRFHMEQMSDAHWWILFEDEAGGSVHVNMAARGKIRAVAEENVG